jgi:hypothetical protein
MALKILSGLKKTHSIKHLIHQRLAGWEEPRVTKYIHASDLMKSPEYCPREQAFIDLGLAHKKGMFVGTSLRITFDHGKSLENNLRNNWLRDIAVGRWKCQVCGAKHPTFGKAPTVKCKTCGYGHMWMYDESRFVSPSSGISGSIDLLVDVGDTKLRLIEVKSMAPDGFKSLIAPLAEHKFRTALYLKLIAESELPESDRINSQEGHILYIVKSFGFKDTTLKEAGIKDSPYSPIREFCVKRDDELIKTPVAKAKVFHHWRINGREGMPAGICSNGLCKRAQSCSAVTPCFSGKYPNTLTWMEDSKIKHPGKKVIE